MIDGVEWWNAELWIGSVEKGQPPEDSRIWFPEGGEPEWSSVPKAYPGQVGVWLLRQMRDVDDRGEGGGLNDEYQAPAQTQKREKRPSERRLMAHDPLDYHAPSNLTRIQILLSRER
jgi:hypothetical protein